jgi:radical SAM protein with 4Fe4S-binding SPASM domain
METVARGLAASLLSRGIDVRVYTTIRFGARVAAGLPDGVVRPLFLPRPRPLRIDLGKDLLTTIAAARIDSPDVIHLCHAGVGPWIPALRAASPAVVTANVHGNDLIAPWVDPGPMEREEYRRRQAEGLSSADRVLAVSRFSASLARREGVSPGVLEVIENGIDPGRFCPGPRDHDLAARLGLAPDDEVMLTVSRLAPRKGHKTALRALAALARPRLKYVFTGTSNDLREEIFALARELGIATRVVSAGFVSDEELPRLYRLARVFVLLPEDAAEDVEGFGVALLEAAATGVPSVASRSGGVPEAVEDQVTGVLVPPADPLAAAQAIARLLDDPALAASLGARGRERVIEERSQERAAERAIAIWNDALARGPRRPIPGGHDIVREAARHEASERAGREARREALRRALERDRHVHVRATSDGARLLPELLEDCAALDHAPIVEVKLRRFLDADFIAYALPLASKISLVHGVPQAGARSILAALESLPDGVVTRVGTVRIFLTPEARAQPPLAVAAVPEAHALRRFFTDRGAVVVPPPELMRYLSELPAGGPETGMIEPTNLCNLSCPTCPTGTGKIKPLPQMTLQRFDRALSALAPRMRNLALWNYGEPVLNKELPAMIARAKQAGVRVVKVSSNVHFLDGERGSALLRSGLDVLILSVDGASQETYATFRKEGDFERVAANVAWLCSEKKRLGLRRPRIELQFIAMRHNEHEIPEIRRLAREWGVDRLRIKTVGADDPSTRDLVPSQRLLSRYDADGQTPNANHAFCTMAWDHTVVNVDGAVTPCCYLRPDMGEAFVMGNVFATSFDAIWRGERYRAFRAAMLAGRSSMPVCNRCRGGTHDLLAAVEEVS